MYFIFYKNNAFSLNKKNFPKKVINTSVSRKSAYHISMIRTLLGLMYYFITYSCVT